YRNSAPQISGGNVITGNTHGIYAEGYSSDAAQNPAPIVTGNSIYDNAYYNYYNRYFTDAAQTTFNATGNWWGTTDQGEIAQEIYDWADNSGGPPVVDYSGYLDGPGGNPAYTGATLYGPIFEPLTLTGSEYLLLGRVEVAAGVTLSIDAGTRINLPSAYPMRVKGSLVVSGSQSSP
ncbi:hypothetical protein, partial [uncultured Microbulbifer sp.]|uniref:hypothetical protein n=1 Tax=uncultured Microbulbifer sp. TaxID=348147 RepID=UPI0026342B41